MPGFFHTTSAGEAAACGGEAAGRLQPPGWRAPGHVHVRARALVTTPDVQLLSLVCTVAGLVCCSAPIAEPLPGRGAFYFGAHHMRNSCEDERLYLSVL